jgi:rubrerythrin
MWGGKMNNISFSGNEIIELGIQIEKNGRDFYNALVKQSKNSEAKKIFEHLAEQEEKHIDVFQLLLDSVEKYEPAESYPEEYFSYMRALAGAHVFTQKDKGKEIAKSITTDKEAIDMGIGFEKDSILLFEGMKKIVPKKDLEIVGKLITEEQNHLRELSELKEKI